MRLKSAVHGFVRNNHGAAFHPDTAARAYPEEHGIHDFGVKHQFNGFVQEDAHRRHTHSVLEIKTPTKIILFTNTYVCVCVITVDDVLNIRAYN